MDLVKYDLNVAVISELDAKYKDFALIPEDPDSKAMLMAGLREYRQLRIDLVAWHKEKKAGILQAGRALDKERADWLDKITPGENRLKAIRKEEDDREAAIEKKRVADIRLKINDIRNFDYNLSKLNLVEMKELKAELESTPIEENEYMEFVGEAMAAIHNVLIAINNAIENRERLDKEEIDRKAEEERLEKERKEQEEKEKILAEKQAQLEEAERTIREEKEKLVAEQRAEQERKEREEFERQAKTQAEREAKEKAEREERERIEKKMAEAEEKARQETLKPDKYKLLSFADYLDAIEPPKSFKDDNCNVIINEAMKIIYSVSAGIRNSVEEL